MNQIRVYSRKVKVLMPLLLISAFLCFYDPKSKRLLPKKHIPIIELKLSKKIELIGKNTIVIFPIAANKMVVNVAINIH